MTHISQTLIKGLILLFLAIFLSSCANDNNFSVIPDFTIWDTSDDTKAELYDKQLENIEPKVCLDEELNALNETGNWDEKSSSEEIVVSDNVFDFPVVLNKKVDMYLDLFQNKQRNEFRRWLARSTIYRPMIEKELEEAGLPKDLVYLAMIESGYNERACSGANAIGLWQFMQATGQQYDLHIDKYLDERRDPIKSTKAAVSYLSDLYKEFDDWYLAVAAYNGGPGTIRSGLKKYKVDNFWELASKDHLHLETKRYVPKLIAALLIAKDPEKYGFTNINYREPLRFDTFTVGPGMSLEAIALITNSTTEEIQRLNQDLRLGKTPLNRKKFVIKIPEATAKLASKNLSRLHAVVSTGYKTHKVAKGDTLKSICRKYNINKVTLLKANALRSGKLAYGRNLRIPYRTITYRLLPEGATQARIAYRDSLILHLVKPGDTLSKIAKQYNVPPEMIVGWNGLKNVNAIRAGQQLALYIESGKNSLVENESVHSGNPGSKDNQASVAYFKADKKKSKKAIYDAVFEWYDVQNGDSLWTISKKFSVSTADLIKWNNLKSNLIHSGSQLKLKKV